MKKALLILTLLFSTLLFGGEKFNNRLYKTVDKIGGTFRIDGELKGYPDHIIPIYGNSTHSFYVAKSEGYHKLSLIDGRSLSLFVSPIDSFHSERSDVNWYRTQFDTTTVSNCGPSVVSMGIGWAKGSYTPVSKIRHEIGFQGVGGTSFNQLENALTKHGVEHSQVRLKSIEEIFEQIQRDQILIFLFNTEMISQNSAPRKSFLGRHYPDKAGHYSLIKGYTKDKKYIIVHDPIPSNWYDNKFRHNDGFSMLGQNRYYLAEELFKALRSYTFIKVKRAPYSAPNHQMSTDEWAERFFAHLKNITLKRDQNILYQECIAPTTEERSHSVKVIMKEIEAINCEEAFSKTRHLTDLNLEKTDMIDLSPLAGLTNLISLRLGGNHFSDLAPLTKLKHLKNLFLWGTKIESVFDLCFMDSLSKATLWSPYLDDFHKECRAARFLD